MVYKLKKMPQKATCGKCEYSYYKKHHKWANKYWVIFTREVVDDGSEAAKFAIERLKKYICYTKYTTVGEGSDGKAVPVHKYLACERCARHDPELKDNMVCHPKGVWQSTMTEAKFGF